MAESTAYAANDLSAQDVAADIAYFITGEASDGVEYTAVADGETLNVTVEDEGGNSRTFTLTVSEA